VSESGRWGGAEPRRRPWRGRDGNTGRGTDGAKSGRNIRLPATAPTGLFAAEQFQPAPLCIRNNTRTPTTSSALLASLIPALGGSAATLGCRGHTEVQESLALSGHVRKRWNDAVPFMAFGRSSPNREVL